MTVFLNHPKTYDPLFPDAKSLTHQIARSLADTILLDAITNCSVTTVVKEKKRI